MSMWFVVIPILFFTLFVITFKFNKMNLVPSFMFVMFVLSSATFVIDLVHVMSLEYGSLLARIVLIILIALVVLILVFGIYLLIIYLLLNTRAIFKRERKSLAHALTLIVALLIILYLIAAQVTTIFSIPEEIQPVIFFIYFLPIYYFFHMICYIIANLLCNVSKPKLNQDYIIVLGCALIEKKPTSLLASRIDTAIAFYEKQKKKTGVAPKLIFSGGQGVDEEISEAEAMMLYAKSKGVVHQDILLEDKSTTTFENMIFCKKIIEADTDSKNYRVIFSTSSYHVLRAGMYAKISGMNIAGIGAKTVAYYFPNAIIREYIAYIVMRKKRNLIFILISLLICCLFSLVLVVSNWLL